MDLAAERVFQTPLVNHTLFPMLLLSLARQRHSPTTAKVINTEYDYIIVGAGSAGSVVAARLSEMPCVNVLLIEAGKAPPLLSEIPGTSRLLWFTDIDWQYRTVPQKYTGNQLVNRQVVWPSGKGLGGSSLLTAMLYVRGNRKDFDEWAAEGADGWSYQDVFPYFLKMEDNRDPEYVANGYHNVGGPQTVHRPRYQPEIKDPIFEAATSMGYRIVDPNGARQTGFYDPQGYLRSGQRCSTAKAYLVPAENRTNLDILPNARVRKVVIKNRRAVGVEFDYQGQTYVVKARKEVIMSAGTINTAQLLMLSGIGPRKELERHKIPIIAELPVGQNLQDHCSANVNFELDPKIQPMLAKVVNTVNIAQYIQNRTGPLAATEFCSVLAFLKDGVKNPVKDSPNFQLYFVEATSELLLQVGLNQNAFAQTYAPYLGKPWYLCLSQVLKPRSRGTVTLNSTDPYDMPLIDPNYFDDPRDMDDVVEGMKACNRIMNRPELRKVGSTPFQTLYLGCEKFAGDEDAYFRCQAKGGVVTMSHQVGTARMGNPNDPRTVVDTHLRVKHVKGLRVVDASVMPVIPSANTNAATIMVAEKASDIIKSTIQCDEHYYEGDWSEPHHHDYPSYDQDYQTSHVDPHEASKNPGNGHWVEITPPENVNVHNKENKNIFLKVTPWNKEIPNVTPWNQEILFLTPDADILSNISSPKNNVFGVDNTEQMRTASDISQPKTADYSVPLLNNELSTHFLSNPLAETDILLMPTYQPSTGFLQLQAHFSQGTPQDGKLQTEFQPHDVSVLQSQNSATDQQSILKMLNDQEVHRVSQLTGILNILPENSLPGSRTNLPQHQHSTTERIGKVNYTPLEVAQQGKEPFYRRYLSETESGIAPKHSTSTKHSRTMDNILLDLTTSEVQDIKPHKPSAEDFEPLHQAALGTIQKRKFSSSCDKDFCDRLLKLTECQGDRFCRKQSVFSKFLHGVLCST